MADLARSNAEWLLFKRRLSAAISYARTMLHQLDRHRYERVLYTEVDPNGNTLPGAKIVLAGVKPGINTTERMKVYVRVTSGSNPRTAALYKATGAGSGDKVAEGSANLGATATLVQANNSGMSGTYPINASVTPDADDLHVLELYMDWRPFFTAVFDGTDGFDEDSRSRDSLIAMVSRNEALAEEMVRNAIGGIFAILVSDTNNARAWGAKFLKDSFFNLLEEVASKDGSGAVVITRAGAWNALRLAMVDESVATTPTVRERVVEAAAAVPGSGNVGQLTMAAHTPEGQCPVSDAVITCVKGYGNGFGGYREEYAVVLNVRGTDVSIPLSKTMSPGQAYRGECGFGGTAGATLKRVFTKTNDGSDVNLSVLTDAAWAVSLEDEQNTSAGIVWWVVTVSGGLNSYKFYRTAAMDAGDLVCESTGVADGAAFTATPKNGSQLTINGKAGSNPVNGTTGQLNMNFGRVGNNENVADSYTVAIDLDAQGEFSRVLAALPFLGENGTRLNGVPSGETWSDDLIKANGYVDIHGESEAA